MVQALTVPWDVKPEDAVVQEVLRSSEVATRHCHECAFGSPLPLSPLSGLNLRPKQCQKSWNREVLAFIIRNSLSPLSGLGIFNIELLRFHCQCVFAKENFLI